MPQAIEFFRNHPLLVMAFIGIVAGLVWTMVAGRIEGVSRLSPLDTTRLINSEDAVLIDVRSDGEFRQGHIINSVNVPGNEIDAQLGKLEKFRSRPVIAVCRTGQLSSRAATALKRHGFERVHILAGGLASWEGANLPLARK